MIDIINIITAVLTIALGGFGLLVPRYTAEVLDLKTGDTTMGLSELRASAGGMFVAVGGWCLWSGEPWAYFMMGMVYLGAGIGRAVALVMDAPPFPKAHLYFVFEAVFAIWLIWANAHALG
ncbi:DUF4345 family protein [Marivita sp. S0852]|uniref:DUF4345 family protein n=1 Tax=Marivita sp. S0852 TaxID=3373893 RepID=UPI003982ADF4